VTVPPAPAIATPNDEPATNAAADYLVRAYGVTLTEAERRLRLQRAVSQLAVRLETQEADTFGDLYIKHRPDFGVTVNFTRDGAATLAKYVTDPELAAVTRAVEVSRTINELRRIQQETGTALDALQIITSSLINAETGRITVFAPALSVIRQAVTTGVLRLPEIVDLVEKPLGKLAARDMTAGHPLYYYNGAPSCTTGFTVQRNGAYGVLTAGHCGDAQYHSAQDGSFNALPSPEYQNFGYGIKYDFQWHRAPTYRFHNIAWVGNEYRTVSGTVGYYGQKKGMVICKYCETTKYTCGDITSGNFYFEGASGFILASNYYGQDMAWDGDSGGPVMDRTFGDVNAYGLATAWEPNPANYNQEDLVYMPIDYIDDNQAGLSVLLSPSP